MQFNSDIEQLWQAALEYNRKGDDYNAIKLCKKVIRLAPSWALPHLQLGLIYKYRREWKPSYHYIQKAVEKNPDDEKAWWNLGIVATALRQWKAARQAWNKTGFQLREENEKVCLEMGLIPVCLHPKTQPEIVWAEQIGPARAKIVSIPQPSANRQFGDIVLIDNEAKSYRIVNGKRLPVFDELGIAQSNNDYQVWLVQWKNEGGNAIEVLDQLCLDAEIGFDNWSKATQSKTYQSANKAAEYFQEDLPFEAPEHITIALAAKSEVELQSMLKAWYVITFQEYQLQTASVQV